MATIFSKIAAGEIPSYKCAEDDQFYAFLDINPVKQGHTLVVPRKEVDYIFDMSDEELAAWALENPENLTSNQVRVLRDCLNRQSSAELFRMSGIDLEALRNVLRNVA